MSAVSWRTAAGGCRETRRSHRAGSSLSGHVQPARLGPGPGNPGGGLQELRREPAPGRDVRPAHRGRGPSSESRPQAQPGRNPGLLRGGPHRSHRSLPRVHGDRVWSPSSRIRPQADSARETFSHGCERVVPGALEPGCGSTPSGFENAYEIAVLRGDRRPGAGPGHALRPGPRGARSLRAGFGYEFIERPDGLAGAGARLRVAASSDVKGMQQALKYQAAGERRNVDVLDVYTTDGRLLVHAISSPCSRTTSGFFPPYEAAALVRGGLFEDATRNWPQHPRRNSREPALRGHHARVQPAVAGGGRARWRQVAQDALESRWASSESGVVAHGVRPGTGPLIGYMCGEPGANSAAGPWSTSGSRRLALALGSAPGHSRRDWLLERNRAGRRRPVIRLDRHHPDHSRRSRCWRS